jgi:hypothetical protein
MVSIPVDNADFSAYTIRTSVKHRELKTNQKLKDIKSVSSPAI